MKAEINPNLHLPPTIQPLAEPVSPPVKDAIIYVAKHWQHKAQKLGMNF